MIFDAHTHIEGLPGCPWQDPPEAILGRLDEAGIDRAAVMTYVDAPFEHPSYDPLAYVKDAVIRYPSRLVGFARLDPGFDDAPDLLERCVTEDGFKGLKLHPYGNRCSPGAPPTLRLLEVAAALRIPTLFHCGDEERTLPLEIERAARAVPEAVIILGHMGGYFHVDDAIEVARRRPNVVLETSAMPRPDLVARALREVGPDRLVFGSDGPGCDPRLELYKLELAGLSGSEWNLVTAGNILRLLGESG